MGQHVWLLLATIITEILVIIKWSQGQFPNALPTAVKWGWGIGATLLMLYPTIQASSRFHLLGSTANLTLYSLGFQAREDTFGKNRGKRSRLECLASFVVGEQTCLRISLYKPGTL